MEENPNNIYRREMLLLKLRIRIKKPPPKDITKQRIKYDISGLGGNTEELQGMITHATGYREI